MPDLNSSSVNSSSSKQANKTQHQLASNKLSAEKQKIETEHNMRIQRMQALNRQNELDRIGPKEDLKLLRLKYLSLNGAQRHIINGLQPVKIDAAHSVVDNVGTFYEHEAKYLGERAELYKNSHNYNPHLLKQHVDLVKETSANRFYSAGDPYISSSLEGRRNQFADKVFADHLEKKREPLEAILTNPNLSALPVVQENGFIWKQTIYGDAYNTKKYLQENEVVGSGGEEPLVYGKIEQNELNKQNVVLGEREKKSNINNEEIGFPRYIDNL
jgi:hypothetical protein